MPARAGTESAVTTRAAPAFTALKEKQRRLRDGFDAGLGLRVHRAISWIRGAERAAADGDADGAFITYWIAFNAAYVQPPQLQQRFQDKELFRSYFERIVRLDRERVVYNAVWDQYGGPIRTLLDNQFVYQPFWRWRHGEAGYGNWRERFARHRRNVNRALAHQDTVAVLETLFDRLCVLRNQLIHGGATWGGDVNRGQVRDGAAIMAALVPRFVDLMMDHPDEDWGEPPYPPVDTSR